MPNGIPVPPPHSDAEERALRGAVRAELGVEADRALVLAVGNLYPVKGHAVLLQAAAKLPGAVVAIAGRGDEEARLRSLAADLGIADRVRLLGLRSDVDRLLAAADLFAHPSHREGLPLAVLEAMAASRAVVATQAGGIPQAVHHGATGLLVPPGDPDALACALGELVDDRARRTAFGAAGRARVVAELSAERMTARYLELYGVAR